MMDEKCMQDNLRSFRKLNGYSMERFGEIFGYTKQSIYKLELGKTPLRKTHLIAFRLILSTCDTRAPIAKRLFELLDEDPNSSAIVNAICILGSDSKNSNEMLDSILTELIKNKTLK